MINSIIQKTLYHYKKIAFALGSLSVLAMPPCFYMPILFITLGWWFYFIYKIDNKKQNFLCGYFFGFGFYSFGLIWIGNALLIEPENTGWLYPLVFLLCGGFFGLFFAIPSLVASYFKNVYHKYFILISSVVLFEWIRSWIFTGFPWNPLGSALGFDYALLQFASVGGVFLLSLLVLYVTTLPALYCVTKNKKTIVSFVLLISATLGFGYYKVLSYDYETSDIKVRIVQPAIAQTMKWNEDELEKNFAKYISMSQENNEDIDIVVWGETATPFALEYDNYHKRMAMQAVPKGGYLVTGMLRYEFLSNNKYMPLNSMIAMNEHGDIINFYDKSHLVPFGEYIPFRKYLPNFISPVVNIIGEFKSGNGPKTIKLSGVPSFGGSICYEIIFPNANVDRKDAPDFLINATNDGWYGNSFGPYQHLLKTQIRAIEEGLSTVRAANTGVSAFISPNGEIIKKIGLNKSGVLDFYLPQKIKIFTLYQLFENYLILSLILITFIVVIIRRKKDEY